MKTLLDQIADFVAMENRDADLGDKLFRRAIRADRILVKLALRAAGVQGKLPKLKADCVAMLKMKLTLPGGRG